MHYEIIAIRGLILHNKEIEQINKRPLSCCNHDILPYMNYCPVCGTDVSYSNVSVNNTNGDLSLFLNPGKHHPIIGFTILKHYNFSSAFNMYRLNNAISLTSQSVNNDERLSLSSYVARSQRLLHGTRQVEC
jgi:hypothetical protein